MGKIILLTGGVRSGKSTHAEELARDIGGDDVLFVATAEAFDEEMAERARKHQASRPAAWRTLESPRAIGAGIRAEAKGARAIIVDCLTVLTATVFYQMTGPYDDPFDEPKDPFNPAIEAALVEEVEGILAAVRSVPGDLIIVTNEVGLGVVPPYTSGRAYRDLLGRANQIAARAADEVILMVSGIPVKVK